MSAPLSPPLSVAPGVDLFVGDCLDVLPTMVAGSVQCCVTSPPYYGLRDYGTAAQIGHEPTPEAYVASLVRVFREVRRVLADDGTLWLNLGDSYAQQGGCGRQGRTSQRAGRANVEAQERDGSRRPPAGLKPKDLIGIPWMVAFALRSDGWWLRSDIVWSKPNPTPESVTDRPTRAHEFLFLLSKSERYFYDTEGGREPSVTSSSGNRARRFRREAGGVALDLNRSNQGFGVPWSGSSRNRRDVWTVTAQRYKGAHFATMPEALAEPCILAGCPLGGRVLDPFAGSGTVGAVARRLGREASLVEASTAYVPLIVERVNTPPKVRRPKRVHAVVETQLELALGGAR